MRKYWKCEGCKTNCLSFSKLKLDIICPYGSDRWQEITKEQFLQEVGE